MSNDPVDPETAEAVRRFYGFEPRYLFLIPPLIAFIVFCPSDSPYASSRLHAYAALVIAAICLRAWRYFRFRSRAAAGNAQPHVTPLASQRPAPPP